MDAILNVNPIPANANVNPIPRSSAIWTVNLSKTLGHEGVLALRDIARMICIQFTVQLLLYFNDARCTAFWTAEFVLLSLYVIMGVLVYWLLLKRLISVS